MDGLVYSTSRVLMRGALRLMSTWKVEGREYVPPRGPLIIVSNHLSNMDPPLLMASLPRRVHFLAKKGLFANPLFASFLRAYGAFPITLDGRDLSALRWAQALLAKDGVIALFPEAHRQPQGGMQKALSGVALLALRSQAPILPVGIAGSEVIGPVWRVAFPTGSFSVKIGQSFTLPLLEGKVDRTLLDSLTDMVMRRVALLLPEKYRGVYGTEEKTPPIAASDKGPG